MRYKISSAHGEAAELIFSMPERPLFIILLAVIGIFCLLLGLAFALPGEGPSDPLTAAGLLGFGLFALCGIFFISSDTRYPSRLRFDNTRGWLSLIDRKGLVRGTIPYTGIAGVSVQTARAETIVRYSAGLDLRRGGRWELYGPRSEAKATAFADSLRAVVDLAAAVKDAPEQASGGTGGLHTQRQENGGVRCEWRRRTRPLPLVISLAAVLAFAAALVGIKPFAEGPGAYVVALVFACVLLATVAAALLRTAGERSVVEISAGVLGYRRHAVLSRGREFRVSLSGISAVDLSVTFTRAETAIALLRPEDMESFARYRQGTFSPGQTLSVLSFLRGLNRIDVSALAPADRIVLAETIREALTSPLSRG